MDSDSGDPDLVIVRVTSPADGAHLRQGTLDRYFSPNHVAQPAAQDITSFTHGADVQEDLHYASAREQHLERTGKRPQSKPQPEKQPKEEANASGDQDVTPEELQTFEENIASYDLDALANGAGSLYQLYKQ
eukprot:gene12710-12840_t